MKVWIEQWKKLGHGISWEGVASLVKVAQHNGDNNLTEKEIDWAYGVKDKMASILLIKYPSKSFILQITYWRTSSFFHVLLHKDWMVV